MLSRKEQKEEERRRGGRSNSSYHSHWSELRKNIGEVSAERDRFLFYILVIKHKS